MKSSVVARLIPKCLSSFPLIKPFLLLNLDYNLLFPPKFFQIKTIISHHFSPLLPVSIYIIIVQCLWKAVILVHDSLAALPYFSYQDYFANDYNLSQGKLEVINGIAHFQHTQASHALWRMASSRKFNDIKEHTPYMVTFSYLFIYFL